MKKTKLVWICSFTNREIDSKLPVWKYTNEYAPWVTNLLKGFEERVDLEIHVISPKEYLKKQTTLFLNNIHYHFIPDGMPIWHRHWPEIFRFDVFSNFYFFKKKVIKTVKRIHPDLISLIGAENAMYSSSILGLNNKYPTLIVIQGFISQMKQAIKLSPYQNKRIEVEETILKSYKYYAGEQDSSTYISNYNSNHIFFKVYFPINESIASNIKQVDIKYDCIFFGRLSIEKGVEDFIKVIAEIKRKKPDVKACIIGDGDIRPYSSLANSFDCTSNIDFIGFLKTQNELFEYVKSSRIFLVTPYFERLSSTIREAMFLKVPIIAYSTGGIPYINEFDENIYLVKTGDYKEVARKAILLLENKTLRINLAEKAYQYANQEYSLTTNTQRLISAYQHILEDTNNHYHEL